MLNRQASPVVTVLRSHGSDAYNPYILHLGHAKSVSTFVVSSQQGSVSNECFKFAVLSSCAILFLAGAAAQFVNDWVRQSTMIWFAGGDQDEYWGLYLFA